MEMNPTVKFRIRPSEIWNNPMVLLLPLLLSISECRLYYPTTEVDFSETTTTSNIQRGKHLVNLMCTPCHFNDETRRLTGIRMVEVPGIMGKIFSRNITNHVENGIGKYSNAELAFLIRTGISRDGRLMPYMQKPNLADEDLRAIVAFLRSDNELVQPSPVEPGLTSYSPVGRIAIGLQKPLPYPAQEIEKPDTLDMVASGYYLVDNLDCYACHSSNFMKIDKLEPDKSKGYMGGGSKLKSYEGKFVTAPNLTFHQTGIADWSEEDFIKALRYGTSKNDEIIAFPMPAFRDLTELEIRSIYAYLKTLKPINHPVKK